MFITIFFVQKSLLDNFFPSSSLTASFHAISDIFPTPLMAHLACALQNYLSILLVHMHMLRRKQKPTRRQEDDFFSCFLIIMAKK